MPALAVARVLRERGHAVTFVGTHKGLESRLVPEAGFAIAYIGIGGLQRVGLKQALGTLWQAAGALWRCVRLLGRLRPNAVLSLGGYVAGPVVVAALLRRIPVVALEPNAVPGLTHRLVRRWVQRALVAFEETGRWFARAEVTGVPVRQEFFGIAPPPREPFTLLITGGSQGSRTLNHAFRDSWPLFRAGAAQLRFLHQSGPAACHELSAGFLKTGLKGDVEPFIANMAAAFAQASLVVCRAGANAVAELAAAGRPAILVPFPHAPDDHQTRNAEALVRAGAAVMVPDREMTGDRLHREVMALVRDPLRVESMARAARVMARPGAAGLAADVLEQAAGIGKKNFGVDSSPQTRNN